MDYNITIDSKILVTGVAGFIGSNLAGRLLEEGYCVVGIDNINDYYDVSLKHARLEKLNKHEKFKFLKLDLFNMDWLEYLFQTERFDVVINLAAQAGVRYSIDNPRSYMMSNMMGFFNLLECCRYYPVKHLVFASSSSVYGGNDKVPFSTTDNVDKPVSLYAATKKSNELMAHVYSKLYDVPATGLRFFTVYGPMGRPDMAYYSFAKKIMNNEPIKIFNNGDMQRDFTYIDDIVEGIMRVMKKAPDINEEKIRYKIYNIGNSKPEKLLYFVECLEKSLGKEAIKEFYPMQPGDVYQTYADISELEKDFDFRPKVSLAEGIEHFAKWYKEYYEC